MKLSNFRFLSGMIVLLAVLFVSCSDDSTNPVTKKPIPTPPSNLQANSSGTDSISIRWDHSTNKDSSWFIGYKVIIKDIETQQSQDQIFDKSVNMVIFSGLTGGTRYQFTVYSVNSDSATSTAGAAVTWASAHRYYDVKLYESNSLDFASGLEIYNETENGPKNLFIADGNSWDIGLNTRMVDTVESWDLGSPSLLGYTKITEPKTTLITDAYQNVKTLDEIWDTEAINPVQEGRYTLNDIISNFVFALKTQDGYFAKVEVVAKDGSVIMGVSPDRYIVLNLSVQTAKDIPFAKILKKESAENTNMENIIRANRTKITPIH